MLNTCTCGSGTCQKLKPLAGWENIPLHHWFEIILACMKHRLIGLENISSPRLHQNICDRDLNGLRCKSCKVKFPFENRLHQQSYHHSNTEEETLMIFSTWTWTTAICYILRNKCRWTHNKAVLSIPSCWAGFLQRFTEHASLRSEMIWCLVWTWSTWQRIHDLC